jgi:hypothetical protein
MTILEQLEDIDNALKNINKTFQDFEDRQEYMRTHSGCCDGLLINGMCMDCKDPAGPQKDD